MSDSRTAGNIAGTKPAAPPAPSEGGKIGIIRKKMTRAFQTFENFWRPIFILMVISSIGFFISGFEDKDVISYSILIAVTVLILLNSWRSNHYQDKYEPYGKPSPILKPLYIIFKFIIATIPQIISIIQLTIIIIIFTKYQDIIYSKNRALPDVFQSFNWGLFIIMLGQIGLINWYLQQNISVEDTFFQRSFLPIFAIIATISSSLMVELYVIIRHFLTDG